MQSRVATCSEDAAALRNAIAAAAAASPHAPLPTPPTDADVRWAASMLLSRAFYLEDVPADAGAAASGGAVDDDADTAADEEDDDDAGFAPNATLALVPWADRRVHAAERCSIVFVSRSVLTRARARVGGRTA